MKQAFNPYLPSWEYIPDAEPHVFNGRVYIYGSHDRFNGHVYCLNDYVCWSAPTDDLGDWRYEGVIYRKTDDPENSDGEACLFAPDVTQGPDGRYYLYYVLNDRSDIGVAVSDEPAGEYTFYGHVQYEDGTRLGSRPGDEPQFDPGLLTEGDKVYLYTGFCQVGDKSRTGTQATVLAPDMITIMEAPVIIAPSEPYSAGSGFEGHEFFEAPSMRKIGDTYYLVYSSIVMTELCYATSQSPTEGFVYGGVIISNNDKGIDTYKPIDKPMYYGGNNHGSIVEIEGQWYVFYHRHTNGTNFSRQACAEKIEVMEDGSIPQVAMTSCGLNNGPLRGQGVYSAAIACNLFTDEDNDYTGGMGRNGFWMDANFPKITQDGRDGDEESGYIFNMVDGATAGFKEFACEGITEITITTRGYCHGAFEIRTHWDGKVHGTIPIHSTNDWREFTARVDIPDGVHDLFFTYRGQQGATLRSFELK